MNETWERRLWIGSTAIFLFILCFPMPSYHPAFSRVLYSSEGTLLAASLSEEGQWCFPDQSYVPAGFATCLRLFEDEYMDFHPGVNPISVCVAVYENLKKGSVVRGGSTLAMQVMRMKNRHSRRSVGTKCLEMLGAVKLSFLSTDAEIIREWSAMAPFGGNTVGLKAASLRYFGRNPDQLSWAEYALLAVMPNSPASANLSVNRRFLLQKRNSLLHKLARKHYLTADELHRSLMEPLPVQQNDIDQKAFHLLMYLSHSHPGTYIFHTHLSGSVQSVTADILRSEAIFLQRDDIRNMSLVVIDTETNQLLAYHGNINAPDGSFSYVDVIQARRSYGSLLKPLLYAHVLETGQMLPFQMIPDIPTAVGDFQPENFDKKFRGAVPFDEMVIQSLNVPAVRVLHETGLQPFYDRLQQLELRYLNKGADHYGLSLILGGGETSLWDLCRLYKGLARNIARKPTPFDDIEVFQGQVKKKRSAVSFSPVSLYFTLKAMSDVRRPREEKAWSLFDQGNTIAWKTGTSYGHKDAWSLGFNGKYMVGVWVGNEKGEGRYDLTGISKAAPVMFRVFRALPSSAWSVAPPTEYDEKSVQTCTQSGMLAGPLCLHTAASEAQGQVLSLKTCQWHRVVRTGREGGMIPGGCTQPVVNTDTLFIIPAEMEYYYRIWHPEYKPIPPIDPSCGQVTEAPHILYPRQEMKLFLPKESSGQSNSVICKAYHRRVDAELFWYVDRQFLGKTQGPDHSIEALLTEGRYTITVSDQWGNSASVGFHCIE